MDFKQLHFFLEVNKEKSISKASNKLHISQPALSKSILHLEEELGIRLFDRSTRHLQITEEGKMMLSHAQQLMRGMEDMKKAAEDIKSRKKGSFKFGLPPVIGSNVFPDVIAGFRKQYPETNMHIIEEGAKIMEKSLLEGNIDVGVAILPVDTELFEVRPLINKNLLLVVSSDHPLAVRKHVQMSELRDEAFLMFQKGFSLYDRVREGCIQAGFEPDITHESTQWDFLVEMVKKNFGITFLPETLCQKIELSGVSTLSVTNPTISWNLAIIWRKNSYQSHAAKEWIHYVDKMFTI
ncbi:DNA-binding transcriptional regulator, LysR family [Alteribacillus persepolensis]|uniref:DNA-binding transcriptional regulator, LysR family n=1 Tax=Alteribacillus persepolensis TaxID=568899 RepID=A0A1G8JTA1_9BACI|nr:LysR family transcriptional regulator [Alteribacillus persepolensis]SDI34432.1 DNA-binding transcriptional regulator, LysR family [Alteribacillus persepolensis]